MDASQLPRPTPPSLQGTAADEARRDPSATPRRLAWLSCAAWLVGAGLMWWGRREGLPLDVVAFAVHAGAALMALTALLWPAPYGRRGLWLPALCGGVFNVLPMVAFAVSTWG